jgi:hypothetical protein
MEKDVMMIRITLWAMIVINVLFLFAEFMDDMFPLVSENIVRVMGSVRAPLMIIELLAIGTLFVDLVVRFDKLKEELQIAHVVSVGFCVISFMFQIFVFYMDTAFLS